MAQRTVGRRELRSFGLIVGGGFAVIAAWPVLVHQQSPRIWALVPAVALVLAGLTVPGTLGPAFRGWMILGETLGWINTRVILGLVYFLLIVPSGMVMRVVAKDPMRRGFEPASDTYRVGRAKRAASHMRRQF